MAHLMKYIKTFEQIIKNETKRVGGKAYSLSIMTKKGLPVPSGFVIMTNAYRALSDKPIPNILKNEILEKFSHLKADRVAVRSSAVSEDSMTTSWAGQLETYLNVTKEDLIKSIEKCWTSVKSERAKAYAKKHGLSVNQEVAIVIQKMIKSEISGTIFTVNPVTKNNNEIMIEAIYGLGEFLADGTVTPYNYILDKETFALKSHTQGEQDVMLFGDDNTGKIAVPKHLKEEDILSDKDLKYLAELALKVENIYKTPQDIEWAREKNNFFIVQSRPITTL